MRNALMFFLTISLACTSVPTAARNDAGSADEAIAMVQKVIVAIKADGREKTFSEINDPKSSKFKDRDLYITIIDMHGKNLAHGANPKMQGKDLIDLRDVDGKFFTRERIELAKSHGKGWVDYKFVNPVTKQIEPKSAYFETYQDIIINCGIYKPGK